MSHVTCAAMASAPADTTEEEAGTPVEAGATEEEACLVEEEHGAVKWT